MKEIVSVLLFCAVTAICEGIPDALPGTASAVEQPGWRERQRLQIVQFLKASTADARRNRDRAWAGSEDSIHRANLQSKLGIDPTPRQSKAAWRKLSGGSVAVEELVATRTDGLRVRALVFSAPDQVPKRQALIAVPNSDQAAERFAGIAQGSSPPQWLTGLLRSGVLVAIPTMVERSADHPLCVALKGKDRRHILHRFGFVVGRTVTGIDVEKVILLRQELALRKDVNARSISIAGVGQGGMTALYAAAVEPAFASAAVLDYFADREELWKEPVDRMIFGQLLEFGDAEVAALVAPRKLIVATSATTEVERATTYFRRRKAPESLTVIRNSSASLQEAMSGLQGESATGSELAVGIHISNDEIEAARNADFESEANYLRRLIEESEAQRHTYSKGHPKAFHELARHEGVPAVPSVPLRPRTRLIGVTDKWTAYEVFVDVGANMELYGHLLLPRRAIGKLPAVICQHGLDGQPKDITGVGNNPTPAYHTFGKALAERGYVVFAPYLTVPAPQGELINELVRRAAPLGMMRTGIEVLKLRRVVDFLQAQPFVDAKRIGYYGLSYGGYSTLWMGPLEPRLAAIVISGHFNDWTAKITNEELSTSYMKHPDEDFYSWNALNRFTHPELIAAMAPRPVMVEFAENDATTTPAWHDRAWAQVKADDPTGRVERDRFVGVHEVGGMRTFEFLDRHLRPEKSSSREYTDFLPRSEKRLAEIADRSEDTLPYIVHQLDASQETRLRDTFTVAGQFRGVELRLSRVGNPGDVIVRFGSAEGAEDLGKARIRSADVTPLHDSWHAARVPVAKLVARRKYHIEITVERGGSPADHYVVYGPKPLGGTPEPGRFVFAYRPVQPVEAKASGEPTHESIPARAGINPVRVALSIEQKIVPSRAN